MDDHGSRLQTMSVGEGRRNVTLIANRKGSTANRIGVYRQRL